MNTIRAIKYQSKYVSDPHWMIAIDGQPLDAYLHERMPELGLIGLVPTWLDWMIEKEAQAIVHRRMKPVEGREEIVPLLMCPDDLDFSCILVVAEVHVEPDHVSWKRLGIDVTRSIDPEDVGNTVDWFPDVPELTFDRAEYEECVQCFERANSEG